MQITRDNLTDTTVKFTISADQELLDAVKEHVLRDLGRNVKVQGFRAGKAPKHLVEKQIDPSALQTEFLEHAVNEVYVQAIQETGLRPTKNPEISITKFVPFSTLEFTAELEVIGKLTLPDYKKLRLARPSVKVTTKDVDEVITNLRNRAADKQDVKRAAQNGDQVIIDFTGVDAKTKESISGADGNDYPLPLGSNTFIPGFEEELVGLKAGEEKTFDITFPATYGVAELQKRKVTFTVSVKSVQKLVEPKLDDAFAATVGPFKTVADLKADIKRQLETERQQDARNDYNNTLLEKLAEETTVTIPVSLIDSEIDRIEDEEKRNLTYRGQTWEDHLSAEGLTPEAHREKNRAGAELRVKAGLILSEVAEREGVTVTPEELEIQMKLLMGRYENDLQMQAELDKPESRRDITSRLLTEKTIDRIAEFATAK